MKQKILFLGLVLSLSACVDVNIENRQMAVMKRASFDFKCPMDQINLKVLQYDPVWENTNKFRVEGCGQKAVYDNVGDVAYKEGTQPDIIVKPAN